MKKQEDWFEMNPPLTREQVRTIDRLATDRYGLSGLVLMENAGINAASIIRDVYGPTGSAFVACGTGNNGGDGCVIARHLHNAGWTVTLLLAGDTERLTPDTQTNLKVVRAMGIVTAIASDGQAQQAALATMADSDVLIDALLGTGFSGDVRSPMAELIHTINGLTKRATVAIDVPSGMDCDTGKASNATIRADLTVTFVAAKVGFSVPGAGSYLGKVRVAGIGIHPALVTEVLSLA